jgi:arylsulfatase A-like enzyme
MFKRPFGGLLVVTCMLAGSAAADEAARPNILFCIADDASFPHMGAYGCTWVETPGFDRVAEQGILFTRCYTPNAKCAPSRSCILTGRNSWQLEQAANHWPHFPAKFKTYAETLAEHNYHVGYTGKGWAPGKAVDADGNPRELAGTPYQAKTTKPPASGISNRDYAANFELFLKARPQGQPFCFWYGGHEPHRAYEYGSGLKYGQKKLEQIDRVYKFWPDNETIRTDLLDYAFEIEYFDRHLQKMLDMLEDAGELDNTLVIVTADNGMPFPRIKGQEYEFSNHLPLAIMWKKGIKNPGRTVRDLVNFIDFAPTFLELAGVNGEQAGMHPIRGRSLTEIFGSASDGIVCPDRDHVLIGKERHDIGRPHDWGYPIRGIVKGDYLYLRNFEPTRWPAGNPETGYLNTDGSPTKTQILNMRRDGSDPKYWTWSFGKRPDEQMFNVVDDPECMNDLAGEADYAQLKEALKKQMVAELREQKDPRMFGHGHTFDEYQYADPTGNGFYERYVRGEKVKAGWVEPSDFEKEPVRE